MDYKQQIRVSPSPVESAHLCASYITELLTAAGQGDRSVTFAISGGNSPKPMFGALVSARLNWQKIHVFWVDERCVPPASDQSNYKLANDALLSKISIPRENVHRIFGEEQPEDGARRYVKEIRDFFSLQEGQTPVFDVIHRGIGPDAHTASLFPGEPLIGDSAGIAAAVWVEKMHSHRVTLLPAVLRAARHTVIQAAGEDKAEPIYNVLFGPEDPFAYPCQIAARDSNRAVWFLDSLAAARLKL